MRPRPAGIFLRRRPLTVAVAIGPSARLLVAVQEVDMLAQGLLDGLPERGRGGGPRAVDQVDVALVVQRELLPLEVRLDEARLRPRAEALE